jgi:hypothetical protein
MASQPADTLLNDIERLRRRTRADLHETWLPLVLFGALSIAGAAVALRFGATSLALFWGVSAPAGSVATAIYYHRREHRVGLQVAAAPYIVAAAAIIVGAFLTGGVGGAVGAATISAFGPPLCISAGYLLFARLARSRGLAAVAVALAVLTVAAAAARMSPDQAAWSLSLIYGVAFLATGLVFRASSSGAS